MSRVELSSTLLVMLLAGGCAPESDPEHDAVCTGEPAARDGGVEYQSIGRTNGASAASVTLCDLVRSPNAGAAGLYEVVKLTGFHEPDLWVPGSKAPFTYVELALRESWHDAGGDAVARIRGGPLPSCSTAVWRVSLSVGEVVGVVLSKAVPENRDHFELSEQGTFKQTQDGGFSNGRLFMTETVSADELGAMITAIADSDPSAPCPFDAVPEGYQPPRTRD